MLIDYRNRVRDYWQSEATQSPSSFILVGPVEVVAVAALSVIWIFAQPADSDSVRVEEAWEHLDLANWDVSAAPAEHAAALAAQALDLPDSAQLVSTIRLAGYHSGSKPWFGEEGQRLADGHASNARVAKTIGQLLQESVDTEALTVARSRLEDLKACGKPQQRGKDFESLLHDILRAHGCDVELGTRGSAEQIDLFMFRPVPILIECRWRAKPVSAPDLDVLIAKLMRRPAIVAGLYISMGGFTSGAAGHASSARDRSIVLADEDDLALLTSGEVAFKSWWDGKVRELIQRYPR